MTHRSEAAVMATSPAPVTRGRLVDDLHALGVAPGDAVLVHSALSAVGWVVGGPRTVIDALCEAVGVDGLVAMPSFTSDLCDPAGWSAPPAPEAWLETLRAETEPFDPARTPTRGMGRIAELFRSFPGVRRSDHPECSMAAWGLGAAALTARHALAFGLGDTTPMGALYARDAKILLLGVDHRSNSSLHLAETRAAYGRRTQKRYAVRPDGAEASPPAGGSSSPPRAVWRTVDDVADDEGALFPAIGADFEASGGAALGPVGAATARLMRQRALVDFAQNWLDRRLGPDGAGSS